jgi:hypothetical protein
VKSIHFVTKCTESLFSCMYQSLLYRDPNSVVHFSDFLYNNEEFTNALSNALGEKGVLVAQLGETDYSDDPVDEYCGDLSGAFIDGLIDEGFQSVSVYTESHGRFEAPWKFFVAMKSKSSRSIWMSSEAEIQLSMQMRSLSSKSGESLFKYFDGPTMKTYEFPPRVMEDVWCTKYPEECGNGHGFDPEIKDAKLSSFEVSISTIAKGGRGVFAREFVAKGSYIGLTDCVNGMFLSSKTLDLLQTSTEYNRESDYFQCFMEGYVDGYGWLDSDYVSVNTLISVVVPDFSESNFSSYAFLWNTRETHVQG